MGKRSFLILVLFLTFGCRRIPDTPPTVYPVRGKVVLSNGEPLRGGRVGFHPRGPAREVFAELGSDGTFTLTSFQKGDGAMPGEYAVSVNPHSYKTGKAVAAPQAPSVPRRYWADDTTPLTATVKEGDNAFTLTVK